MRGTGVAIALCTLATLACGGGPPVVAEPIEVEVPAPEADSPPPAPAQAIELEGTHCDAGEIGWFSCQVAGGKVLSLCSTNPFSSQAGSLYYRFGKIGAVEMSWPTEPTPFWDAYSYEVDEQLGGMGRPPPSTVSALSFATPDARFTVRSTQVVELSVAIVVEPTGKQPITIPCTSDVRGEVYNLELPVAFDPGL